MFGQKSERFAPEAGPDADALGRDFRRSRSTGRGTQDDCRPYPARCRKKTAPRAARSCKFFDESKVPVETIVLVHAEVQGVPAEQFELIGEKVTYRLAQRPGSYMCLKYHRPVIKRKDTRLILACRPRRGP